jgi:L-histidine Nalpha-methyltransferase
VGRGAVHSRESFVDRRLSIDRRFDPVRESTLADDVRRGLGARRKHLPPKHFYDEEGSRLFDRICELPEYYLTRAEEELLGRAASEIMARARPTDLIELGSGAARKTRLLLDAAEELEISMRYHPIDVCEPMIRESGEALLSCYPWLEVHGIVADYERNLDWLPEGERRLVAFLGSTIGNFSSKGAAAFVTDIARALGPGETFLLGADLVKPVRTLEAAYDDAEGVTAEFNRNVLRVINRELGADFDPGAFDHVAFFHPRKHQIEMHLRARRRQRVTLEELGMTVDFAAGETLHTEVSRKFTRRRLEALFRRAGLEPCGWFESADPAFALVLGVKPQTSRRSGASSSSFMRATARAQ